MQITVHTIAGLPGQPDDVVTIAGDTITVNGTDFDLSSVSEGDIATPEGAHPFVGTITREAGEINVGLRLVYSTATAVPDQPTAPIVVQLSSGTLPDPIIRKGGAGQ